MNEQTIEDNIREWIEAAYDFDPATVEEVIDDVTAHLRMRCGEESYYIHRGIERNGEAG